MIQVCTSIRARGDCRITIAGCSAIAGDWGVALESLVQINHNAYLHGRKAFGGKPQRLRTVQADYDDHVAELLAKAAQKCALDGEVTWDMLASMEFTSMTPAECVSKTVEYGNKIHPRSIIDQKVH